MQDLQRHFGLTGFSGLLPLFPLPGVVLFPCTLLPLHIFEPRYRAMVADAAAKEACIGMVLPRPGWEPNYYGNPAIHEVACLGKIIDLTKLPDGRFNIVLCGVKRARIDAVVSDKPYRTARVELLEDRPIGTAREGDARAAREQLLEVAEEIPTELLRHKNFARALRKLDAPLGCSADLMADAMLLSAATKQQLLDELDPMRRAETLLRAVRAELRRHAGASAEPARTFPPQPSVN